MDTVRKARRRRRVSLALSTTALVVPTVLLGMAWLITVTVSGAASIAAVIPIGAFLYTSWVWALLALVALVLGARGARRILPVGLAVVALVAVTVAALLLLPI